MRKTRFKKGFTVAEALIVVAIIAVLGALAVVAVFAYMRSMAKLKYDAYAKEIFVAAQNHLSMSESQGYLGREEFGFKEGKLDFDPENTGIGAYYFVKSPDHEQEYHDVNDASSVLNLMLPFAAVDETVRVNGCYIVRYHKDSATVLDVFYWQENDNFSHIYIESDYSEFMRNRGNKSALKNYGGSVIGYYGGASADTLAYGKKLSAPIVVVSNEDRLTVTVTDPNRNINYGDDENAKPKLKLIMTGVTSGELTEFKLFSEDPSAVADYDDYGVHTEGDYAGCYYYVVVLDSITSKEKHFYNQFCLGVNEFIPGEDIEVQAVAYNNSELTNIAYSPKYTTNSLFAYNEEGGAAHIAYIRHLENLDTTISKVNVSNRDLKHNVYENNEITVKAKQIKDLTWDDETYFKVFGTSGLLTELSFAPVEPYDYSLEYNGEYNGHSHSVTDVVINVKGSAGLFASLDGNDTVKNLKLINFEVTTQNNSKASTLGNAGALVGELNGGHVTNIVAYNTFKDMTAKITGTDNVGGLIGIANSGEVSKCAAALVVKSTGGNAGGLVGTVKNVNLTACYSGGHTENGAYSASAFNVAGTASAGGLVGEITGTADKPATVVNCYSTCSVKGDAAGGFIGKVTNGSITNCYSTGLVNGTRQKSDIGAFIGISTGTTQSNCWYYEIINELEDVQKNKHKGYKYLDPVGNGSSVNIKPFDDFEKEGEVTTYARFVGSERSLANAYDSALIRLYQGRYALITVKQLGAEVNGDFVATHYGDWPAPEITVINEK